MNLQELREKIDEVDGQLVQLIEQRMDIAGQIADYKKENHLPVLDAAREREKLARVRMFMDLWTGKNPKFLGEPVEIGK